MIKVRKDLTGQIFERLTVLYQAEDYISPSGSHVACWWCRCICGKELSVRGDSLKSGRTLSCGCLNTEKFNERRKINPPKQNFYDLSNEYGICYNNDKTWFCYFDKEDYDLIKPYYWNSSYGYARTVCNDGHGISMHRLVMRIENNKDEYIDHINGCRYDNRKINLRTCTMMQNSHNRVISNRNTSGMIGVYYNKRYKKWEADICVNYKTIYLGRYVNFEDAVKARKKAEEKYFGEFSYDNSRNK